jgi:BA14K-like protein
LYGHFIALPAISVNLDQCPPLFRWASSSGIIEKGGNMRIQGTGNSVRQRMTRVLAAGVLLFMYAFGMVATTGAFVAAGVSPAFAQRGRGRGGSGWGRGGGWGRGNGVGAAVGIGVGAAIIGGAIAASAAEQQRRDAISYCMQRYRSYDPESMTYLGRDGLRRSCP